LVGRPKKRAGIVDTRFFDSVTAAWLPTESNSIDPKYHEAANALADWAGPEWHASESGFWRLRHFLVDACEKWRSYDWQADFEWFHRRKAAKMRQPDLERAVRRFLRECESSLDQRALHFLAIQMLATFFPDARIEMSREEGVSLAAQSLLSLERYVSLPDQGPVKFGPLEYDRFPRELPSPRTAISIVLADIVTTFRSDGQAKATSIAFPRKPELSHNLPWVSLAHFADAVLEDDEEIGPEAIAKSVKSSFKTIARIYRSP
jgi:hypothetical protein